jgi:hypothetical protein
MYPTALARIAWFDAVLETMRLFRGYRVGAGRDPVVFGARHEVAG